MLPSPVGAHTYLTSRSQGGTGRETVWEVWQGRAQERKGLCLALSSERDVLNLVILSYGHVG